MVSGVHGPKKTRIRWACTLAPRDKYGWTIVRGGYEWVCHHGGRVGDVACSRITLDSFVMTYVSTKFCTDILTFVVINWSKYFFLKICIAYYTVKQVFLLFQLNLYLQTRSSGFVKGSCVTVHLAHMGLIYHHLSCRHTCRDYVTKDF